MNDYYQILGVPRNADLPTIKSAFRKRALESHPDRGGSHEKMLLVNEAWGILSNPELRRRYDEYLANTSNQSIVQIVQEDARQAHEHASNYPRDGAKLDSWLDSLLADFANATYAKEQAAFGLFVPTSQNSESAEIFIGVGAVVGLLIGGAWIGSQPSERRSDLKMLAVLLALGGAWVGRIIHQMVRDSVRSQHGTASNGPEPDRVAQIVGCKRCGAQLRVPSLKTGQHIRCPKCGWESANYRVT